MNAIVAKAPQPVTPMNDAQTVMGVIDRAARDPNVDIDKLERLLQMHERITASNAESAFNVALNACQAAVGRVSANAENPQTRSAYATYAKLDKVLRPIYTANGFSLSFDEGESPKPEHVRVLCHVSHSNGHTRTYHKDMPADGKGAKGGDVMTKTHASGAAQSYGMRYLLKGIFNIAIGEDDHDGNETGDRTVITASQVADLNAMLDEVGANKANFLKYINADSLESILAVNFASVVKTIEAKRRAQK